MERKRIELEDLPDDERRYINYICRPLNSETLEYMAGLFEDNEERLAIQLLAAQQEQNRTVWRRIE